MKLKFVLDNLDGVDDSLKGLYEKGDDGKYHLQVDGGVDKGRLDEFRNNNIALRNELDQVKKAMAKFENINLDEYADLQKQSQALREKKLIDAGKIDELVEERVRGMRDEFTKKVTGLETERTGLMSQLEKHLIDGAVATAAAKAGIKPGAIDVVSLLARQTFKLKDGKAIPMDGDKVVYGNDGSTPLSVDAWVSSVAESRPFLFEGSSGGGGQGGQGGKGGGGSTISGSDPEAFGANLEGIASGKVQVM